MQMNIDWIDYTHINKAVSPYTRNTATPLSINDCASFFA